MATKTLPSRLALWIKFGFVLLASGAFSGILASLSDKPFWLVWIAIMTLAIAGVTAALAWIHAWAMNDSNRVGQFRLASIFYLIMIAAVYLTAIRWIVLAAAPNGGRNVSLVGMACVGCILLPLAVVPMLFLSECVVWTAAWIVHRPRARRVIQAGLRRIPRL